MKARAPDIMVRMEYYLHLQHFSLQSPLELERVGVASALNNFSF